MTATNPRGLVEAVTAALAKVPQATVRAIPMHQEVPDDDATPAARRTALAVRIMLMRKAPMPVLAPLAAPAQTVQAPDPAPEPAAPPPPVPEAVRRAPRATFSAVSLDDAAALLAAAAAVPDMRPPFAAATAPDARDEPDLAGATVPQRAPAPAAPAAETPAPRRKAGKAVLPGKDALAFATSALAALLASDSED